MENELGCRVFTEWTLEAVLCMLLKKRTGDSNNCPIIKAWDEAIKVLNKSETTI